VTKPQWDDRFNGRTAGQVDEDDESTIIWVNRDFDVLAKALSSSKLTADQVQTRADRYQYPIACGLWLQHHELKDADPHPDEIYLKGEMQRLAEALLVAMDPVLIWRERVPRTSQPEHSQAGGTVATDIPCSPHALEAASEPQWSLHFQRASTMSGSPQR
jgi:hypothetical protein